MLCIILHMYLTNWQLSMMLYILYEIDVWEYFNFSFLKERLFVDVACKCLSKLDLHA